MPFVYTPTGAEPQSWDVLTLGTFQNLGMQLANFMPRLILALVIVLIGWLLANLAEKLVRKLLLWSRIDELLQKTKAPTNLSNVGLKANIVDVVGFLVKWFVLLMVFAAAADVLQWQQVTLFFNVVIGYLPQVAVAVLLVAIGFLVSQFIYNLITGSNDPETSYKAPATTRLFASIAKWAIIVFVSMAALVQLGIAQTLIHIAFIGFVGMLALAGGLAFGLGGRDKARELLDELKPKAGAKHSMDMTPPSSGSNNGTYIPPRT